MFKSFFRGLGAVLISIALLGYIGYHVLRGNQTHYTTSVVLETTYADTVTAPCWFVRDEVLLQTEQTGYLRYAASDGEKIAKGGVVAQVFAQESAITDLQETEALQAQLTQLQSLSAGALEGTRPSTVAEKIAEQMTQLMRGINRGTLTELDDVRERIRYYFSEKQIITGEMTDFSAQIAELQAQIADRQAKAVAPAGVLRAPAAGYFAAEADGYETLLTVDGLTGLTADALRALTPAELPAGTVGKLSRTGVWYAACILPAAEARLFTVGSTLTLTLPDSGTRVRVQLERVLSGGVDGDAVALFSGSEMTGETASVRSGDVRIERSSYRGLQVNRDAVHIEQRTRTVTNDDGTTRTETVEVQGVYVVYGEQVRFREIAPLYWGEDIVICDASATRTADAAMLKQYDQVISGGRNLYDGKSIV